MEQYRKIDKIRDICTNLFIQSKYAWVHLLLLLLKTSFAHEEYKVIGQLFQSEKNFLN